MRRIKWAFVLLALVVVFVFIYPEKVSVVNVLGFSIFVLVALVVTVVLNPVTEYIPVERWKEVAISNSFRNGINLFRDKEARYFLSDGSSFEGKLVGRSDAAGTFTVEVGHELYNVFPQAMLRTVQTTSENTPSRMLDWEEDTPLIEPRSC